MFCPNCGKQATTDQNFCRSCGFSLPEVAQLVARQLPAVEPSQALIDSAESLQRHRRVQRWGDIGFRGALIGFIVLVISAIYTGFDGGIRFVMAFLLLACLVSLPFFKVLSWEAQANQSAILRQRPKPAARPQAAPTAKLPPERRPEPMPSVTEHTTELLEGSEAPAPASTATYPRA
jgi:hypothetical protein